MAQGIFKHLPWTEHSVIPSEGEKYFYFLQHILKATSSQREGVIKRIKVRCIKSEKHSLWLLTIFMIKSPETESFRGELIGH